MEQCNYNEKVTNLTNNDFTFGGRLKGEIVTDANTVLGIGTFAYVVLAGSANMPAEHNYILSNQVDVSTGNFTQFATPTSFDGSMSFRTNTNGIFSNWNILAKMSDLGGSNSSTVENVILSEGSGYVNISKNKTRVSIMDAGGGYAIGDGNFEGDELVIIWCSTGETLIDMIYMDGCNNKVQGYPSSTFDPAYFWWSTTDNCWLLLIRN